MPGHSNQDLAIQASLVEWSCTVSAHSEPFKNWVATDGAGNGSGASPRIRGFALLGNFQKNSRVVIHDLVGRL